MAGPLGFSGSRAPLLHSVLRALRESLGYEFLDPWGLTDARKIEAVQRCPTDRRSARRGGRSIERWARPIGRAIDDAHGVIAILDGTDVEQRHRGGDRLRLSRAASASSGTGAISG